MIYAVSDIHGDLAMYIHIVNMLKGDDLLYIVGDVIGVAQVLQFFRIL